MGLYDLSIVRVGLDFKVDFKVDIRKFFREPKVLRWTQENMNMSHEWSGVVSAEVKEEYMTLQGRLFPTSLLKS